MNSVRWISPLSGLACLVLIALTLCACKGGGPGWKPNEPMLAKGPSFDQSFETVQIAMKNKGYVIAKADKSTGHVQTDKRTSSTWWWVLDAQVRPDGMVEFTGSGSEQLQKGDKVHFRLRNYIDALKRAFEQQIALAQPIKT